MKNLFTYLKALGGAWGNLQSKDVRHDCRLTVGSPSVKCGSTLMRLVAISAFLLTIGVGNAWGETSSYSASANTSGTSIGAIDGWTGSGTGTYTGSGNQSVRFDSSGDSYTKSNIWSGAVSSGMTSIEVTLQYKINGTGDSKNVFTISAINSSGTVKASQTFAPTSTTKTTVTKTITVKGSDAVTGLKLTYTTKKDGNVGIFSVSATATYTVASCGTNPTAGTASLNGSISLSSFPVQTTGWTVGSNCAWTDFGFVWSSTVSTPTLAANGTASSGCTKIQKATSGTSTSTTHSITGSFETGTTYYVRGYGKNGYASGTYQYTDVLTITPRSVEFNSNGGSAVDTKYVNSGTKVTAPSDPTKTGYNFGEWQLNSSEFDFANTNVTSNITLVATWTAKTTTVSFNQNSGTGGQTGTLTATYGSAMPSAPVTCPTRTGYDFGGYYDGSGGTGTKYYNADGSSATNWDKENSTWTLYAKWTVKSYSVTWKVNNTNYSAGGSTSVNHGSRVATLPTAPDPGDYCGDKFVGWTTDAEYVHGTSPLYTTASGFPNATGAQIFYAVFADYDE